MINHIEQSEAGRQYAAAYSAHYTTRDLLSAMGLYKELVASHPHTREATYSWAQIQNIVNAVVPRQELLEAQMALVVAHIAHDSAPPATGQISVAQPVSIPALS